MVDIHNSQRTARRRALFAACTNHATRATRPGPQAWRALAVSSLLLLGLQAAMAQGCLPRCISSSSVVHAAGVPPDFLAAAKRLRFQGDTLAPADAAVVTDMARALKALPPRAVLSMKTAADAGLAAPAARKQATARAQALKTALVAAGVAADRLNVSGRR